MITLRPGNQRGFADHGWLNSFHSFSFAGYHDPRRMGWGNLRVINEDRIAPGSGFGAHAHRDMEIVSYVLDGALAHRDDIGNASAIVPGDVQRMSAGSGVRHSEFNQAPDTTTHFLQIWIEPAARGIAPGYQQKHFDAADKRGRLRLVAGPAAAAEPAGAVTLHADASIYAGLFDGPESATLPLDAARKAYVQLVRGSASVNGRPLQAGDAALFDAESSVAIDNGHDAEVLVFDLAA